MQKKISLTVLSVFTLLILILSGCSTQSGYKLLSVFFDGVPNPSEKPVQTKDTGVKNDSINKVAVAQNEINSTDTYHPPYRDRQCESCHDKNVMGKLLKPQPALCYDCHEDFSTKYNTLHGPVASGYCSLCHNPHMSSAKKLLLREKQSLCIYCHDKKQVLKNKVHKEIKETACTECHNPHGGSNRTLLK